MRVIVTGGGTGGHVFPALAIIEELRRRDPHLELWYVGKRGNIEERLTRERGIPFRSVAAGALARRGGIRNGWSLVQMGVGFLQSLLLLLRFRPQIVLGTGGYVCVPPVIAARVLRVPTLIHEQNSIPGRANRLLAKWVNVVTTTFTESVPALAREDVRVTGNPVRAEVRPEALAKRDRGDACRLFDLDPARQTVLVIGGSQGASALTAAALDALPRLSATRTQMLLMTGEADAADAAARAAAAPVPCTVRAFIEDMGAAYVAADVVVCRAGASTLAEVTGAGLPAILVPYPYAVDDHQRKNAQALVRAGAAEMLAQEECTGESLGLLLSSLLDDPARRRAMAGAGQRASAPAAAETIADLVCDLAIPGGAAP